MTRYLLDANVFITPANSFYTLEGCPGFWEWLGADKALCSIREVYRELQGKEDELARWARAGNTPDFLEPDEDVQQKLAEVSQHVMGMENFTTDLKMAFLSGADSWLIATALVKGWTIVTEEKYNPQIRHKIQLPNVAREMEVRCINLFELTAARRLRLVWDRANFQEQPEAVFR